jgi:penicillin-binding protein 1C
VLLFYLIPLPKFKTYSQSVYSSDSTLLTAYLTEDDKWRLRTRLDEVSPELIKAIIEKEDKYFYRHPGFNPFAIVRAMFQNIVEGKRVSGASTITMQLARILEPSERSYVNKFIEILRAVQLEFHFSKDEILEIYLSYLPYGGNIEGIKSASFIYFNRPPGKLSLAQAITLAVIPNDPNKYRLDKNVVEVINKRDKWINKFLSAQIFPEQQLTDAKEEILISQRFSLPSFAPHFTYYVAGKYEQDQIYTNLELKIQSIAEDLLLNYVNRNYGKGISNGALMVIDNTDNSVKAYCGSANFYDELNSGQVNGITAVRSPGSTLKPALYAYAFDLGILTPKMKLNDIPTDFSGYEPENYDLKFNGPVTAEYALVNSLNVPAVGLLQKAGFNRFISLLVNSGFEEISKQKKYLGLSTILGGCGVKHEQLTRLFTAFANKGKLRKLHYLKDEKEEGKNAFSEEASYLIAEILSQNERPDFPAELIELAGVPRIAWKTGTSYGKRDAWAIGFNKNYTIGVWMGNFSGKGSPYLSGSEMAVPLLFELFKAIDKKNNGWFQFPLNLLTRKVCSETGLVAGSNCKHTIDDYWIEDVSHQKTCDLYKEIYVSEDGGFEYCPDCLPDKNYKKESFAFYEPELALWFDKNNIEYDKPPKHNPDCQFVLAKGGPKIISPAEDFEYLVEENSEQEILLQAASNNDVDNHYWYINDEFYKKGKPGEKLFFNPGKGEIKITCLDDKGRDETIFINVSSY